MDTGVQRHGVPGLRAAWGLQASANRNRLLSTRDLDLAAPVSHGEYAKANPLPLQLAQAAVDVANALGLPEPGAQQASSTPDFPRTSPAASLVRRYGRLTLHVASRYDHILVKLYAAADLSPNSKHPDDLRRLQPTLEELAAAASWTIQQDPSEGFRLLLRNALGNEDVDSLL